MSKKPKGKSKAKNAAKALAKSNRKSNRKRMRKLLKGAVPDQFQALLEQAEADGRASIARELQESFAISSDSGNLTFAGHGFAHDEPGEVWNSVGLFGHAPSGHASRRYPSLHQLRTARDIGRWLAEENEFVIGSSENRVSYTVGDGLTWSVEARKRAVPGEDLDNLIAGVEGELEDFREQESMDLVEQEWVRRLDYDGNAILDLLADTEGPMRVRFIEPETIAPPSEREQKNATGFQRHALSLGVQTDPKDVRTITGYWILDPEKEGEVKLQRADDPDKRGFREVEHGKLNVHLASPMGWPTYWPIRQNMARSEKLLRNMSWVATIQAAIALVVSHENASETDVEALLSTMKSGTVTNNVTGNTQTFQTASPGQRIDLPAGSKHETPISSVNAPENVAVLKAEHRAGASAVNQPVHMFAGDTSDGSYASTLVADGPPAKNFTRLQGVIGGQLKRVNEAAIKNAILGGRLPGDTLRRVKLVPQYPSVIVRDHLQDAQKNLILFQAEVMSEETWQEREGLDPAIERGRKEAAAKRKAALQVAAAVVIGVPATVAGGGGGAGAVKPAPGDSPGGAGGGDKAGNLGDPGSATSGVDGS